ncbi:hypothetical protein NPIL_272601 [Nephila pilipes]|uniref:Uncharacterized protein n=1 Tax=Nephila pilipes TaxID=299642 RepID=A0A8X6UJE1_NEPPI|nr:hypothetical protein NPIL_272601 [Nephila pilipes]
MNERAGGSGLNSSESRLFQSGYLECSEIFGVEIFGTSMGEGADEAESNGSHTLFLLNLLGVIETVEGQEIFCSKTKSSMEISETIDTSSFVSSSDEESYYKTRGANEVSLTSSFSKSEISISDSLASQISSNQFRKSG